MSFRDKINSMSQKKINSDVPFESNNPQSHIPKSYVNEGQYANDSVSQATFDMNNPQFINQLENRNLTGNQQGLGGLPQQPINLGGGVPQQPMPQGLGGLPQQPINLGGGLPQQPMPQGLGGLPQQPINLGGGMPQQPLQQGLNGLPQQPINLGGGVPQQPLQQGLGGLPQQPINLGGGVPQQPLQQGLGGLPQQPINLGGDLNKQPSPTTFDLGLGSVPLEMNLNNNNQADKSEELLKSAIAIGSEEDLEDEFSFLSGANIEQDIIQQALEGNVTEESGIIVKSSKQVETKTKSRAEQINEYIDENVNFWYYLNQIHFPNLNADPNIDYKNFKSIKNQEEVFQIDFAQLKKHNFTFHKKILNDLNELKEKYNSMIIDIKKLDIFKDHIDMNNIRLDAINIEHLRGILNHKMDTKIRNFCKNPNPYFQTMKADGTIEQETKDLMGLRKLLEIDIIYDVLGQSAIFPFLKNPDISEVMIIGPYKVYIEVKGRLVKAKVAYVNDEPLTRYAREIATSIDRSLDSIHLSVDARLPDGSRFHGIMPPVARFGPTLTIRKFSEEKLRLEDLEKFGSLSSPMAHMIRSSVASKLNIIVAGGTGSGKTTMLNICSNYIGEYERTITVEDSAELQLIQDHVISLETKEGKDNNKSYTIRDLVKECLRMRPDRIICGECRGGEAWDMLVAMNTGHEGSMTTIHANNPVDTVKRVANMVAQVAGDGVPMRVIYEQIASSVDMIIYQARLHDGSRKTTYISEVRGYNVITQNVEIVDIFKFVITGEDEDGHILGEYRWTGNLPSEEIIYKVHSKGFTFPDELEEAIKARTEKLEAMHTLDKEKEIIDNTTLDITMKERVKMALEVLRTKESENEEAIIDSLDIPKSMKQKFHQLLELQKIQDFS